MGFGAVSQPFELMLVAFRGLGMGAAIRGIYSGEDIFINLALYCRLRCYQQEFLYFSHVSRLDVFKISCFVGDHGEPSRDSQ